MGRVLLALLVIALVARLQAEGHVFTSDTLSLASGTAALDACLQGAPRPCTAIDKWPLLQYMPTLAAKRLGAGRATALDLLAHLNGLAVLGTLALAWVAGRRARIAGAAPLLVAALVASPLLWYGSSGFGEPLAGLFVALLAVALILGWPAPVVALALVGAGLSKETALPFLLALALVCLRAGKRRPSRATVAALVGGSVVVLAASAGFNLLRFGTAYNTVYTDPDFAVPDWSYRLSFLAAQFAGPDAGLVFFWPLATLVAILALRSPTRNRGVVLAALAALCALCVTFASWWSPFGWVAWGARLMVPWVPALLIVLVCAAGPGLAQAVEGLARRRVAAVAVSVAVAVLALGQLGAFLAPVEALTAAPSPAVCSRFPPNAEQRVAGGDGVTKRIEEQCVHQAVWRGAHLRQAYRALTPGRAVFALLFLAALAALATAAVAEARAAATGRALRPSPRPGS